MKIKNLLRFYFYADSLERAFDNLILYCACASGGKEGEESAEYVCRLIGEKGELSELWNYLDGKMRSLDGQDRASLEEYAAMRCGLKRLDIEKRRELKRAVVKFTRRLNRIDLFAGGVELVGKYYCLLGKGS